MKKFLLIPLAIILIAGLIFTGCAKQAPAPAVLKIGSLVSLQTAQGIEIQKWMNLFAKIYNEQGGWEIGGVKYQVQVTIYDCGIGDATKTRAAVEKAVLQDGIKYIVNTWLDIPSVDITITEPKKVLLMGVDFTDATIDPNLNYTVRARGLYFARGVTYAIQKDMMARGAKTELVLDPDSEQGKVGNFLWSESARKAGMEVLEPMLYPQGTTDFAPVATKIKSLNPDLVELAFIPTGDEIANIIGALYDAGYKGIVMPGNLDPTLLDNIVKKVGKDYVEGWETVNFDPRGIQKDPKMLALIDRYTQEYGEFRTEGINWITPWFLFEDAVNSTQSTDVDVLAKYLQDSKHAVMSINGYTQLFARPDLNNYKTIDVAAADFKVTIRDGKMVPIQTITVKDHYLASIYVYGLVDVYQKYWDEYGKPNFPNEPSFFDFSDLTK